MLKLWHWHFFRNRGYVIPDALSWHHESLTAGIKCFNYPNVGMDSDCNYRRTGLSCLDLDGPLECQCDPGTIWVPESERCLNRGGVLCEYWNFQPDNSSCASGTCLTKCRTHKKKEIIGIGDDEDEKTHSVFCIDVCSKYIGETDSNQAEKFQKPAHVAFAIMILSSAISVTLPIIH